MGIHGRVAALVLMVLLLSEFSSAYEKNMKYVPGEYVVKLKKSPPGMDAMVLGLKLGSYVKNTIFNYNLVVVKRPVVESAESAIAFLQTNSTVEYAEPNYIYHATHVPNDPDFGLLWGLKNTGQKDADGSTGVPGIDIDVERAWNIETGSENTVVAVIDSGIYYSHPELRQNIWINYAENNGVTNVDDDGNGIVDDIFGANFADDKNINGNPADDNGHGTHCAGTIGATGNNSDGIAGVNWKVKLMAVKFLDKDGGGSLEGAILAIDYALKMGAKILSNSWGGGEYSKALEEIIQKSHEQGAVFVAAAGNNASDNDSYDFYPANYDAENVISVAAIDNKGELAPFSNYGVKKVHIAAPGVNIYSTSNKEPYENLSGTSMAAPHVAGVAALMLSHTPSLSNIEIKNRIIQTASPLVGLKRKVKSGGMISAYNALTNSPPKPDPNDPANWQSQEVELSTEHPYPNGIQYEYQLGISGANELALYFSKFDTENNYDKVKVFDQQGQKVFEISGHYDDSYSPVIKGDWVRIVFETDDTANRYGFDVTKMAYR